MAVEHVFLDANVLLDYLLMRQPFSISAKKLLSSAETKEIRLSTSSLTICNISCILHRQKIRPSTPWLIDLLNLVDITPVGKTEIVSALHVASPDFEDAVQTFSATSDGTISAIITRDKHDFLPGIITIQSPEEFLVAYEMKRTGG